MRRRVEEVLDALGIAHLRDRSPATLSGGERQRCAIAGALAAAPAGAGARRADVPARPAGRRRRARRAGPPQRRPRHHRRARRAPARAGRAPGRPRRRRRRRDRGVDIGVPGPPAAVLADYPGAPTVTRLGRLLGWDPLPLTVPRGAAPRPPGRARPRAAPPSRRRRRPATVVAARPAASPSPRRTAPCCATSTSRCGRARWSRCSAATAPARPPCSGRWPAARAATAGDGRDAGCRCAYVPQDPNSLLFAPTVRRELEETQRLLGRPDRPRVDHWLDRLGLDGPGRAPPPQPLGRPAPAGGHRRRGRRRRRGAAARRADPRHGRGVSGRPRGGRARPTPGRAGRSSWPPTTSSWPRGSRRASSCSATARWWPTGAARTVLAGSLFAPQVLRVLPAVPHRRGGRRRPSVGA